MTRHKEASLKGAIILSAVAHIALLTLLALNYDFWDLPPEPAAAEILEVETIDVSEIKQMQRKAQKKIEDAERKERERLEAIERVKEEEIRKEQEQKEEQARIERQREEDRIAQVKATEEKARKEKEQKELALKKEQEERKKKEEAEKKRKAEEARKKKEAEEKKKREEEARKKKEADEKKKREEEAKRRAQQESELEEMMAAEAEAAAARRKAVLSEVEKYKLLIYNKVKRNWIVPANPMGSCRIQVRLGPGGIVLDVTEGIGDAVLCRSAVAAVRKAEPLPVPENSEVFNEMRSITFTMDPKDKVQP